MDIGANEEITSDDIPDELAAVESYINAEISDDLIQQILDEIRGDTELSELCLNTFPDDMEMLE